MKVHRFTIAAACLFLAACGGSSNMRTTQQQTSDLAPEAVGNVVQLNKSDFLDKIIDYQEPSRPVQVVRPTVVDFYAEWCGPCKDIAPILDHLSREYNGRIDFYKVDIDDQPEIAQSFGIMSIPMVYLITEEGDIHQLLGSRSEEEYRTQIRQVFGL